MVGGRRLAAIGSRVRSGWQMAFEQTHPARVRGRCARRWNARETKDNCGAKCSLVRTQFAVLTRVDGAGAPVSQAEAATRKVQIAVLCMRREVTCRDGACPEPLSCLDLAEDGIAWRVLSRFETRSHSVLRRLAWPRLCYPTCHPNASLATVAACSGLAASVRTARSCAIVVPSDCNVPTLPRWRVSARRP